MTQNQGICLPHQKFLIYIRDKSETPFGFSVSSTVMSFNAIATFKGLEINHDS
jgi:hypothetical protein